MKPNRFVNVHVQTPVWTGCTVTTEAGGFCDAPVPEGAPISACGVHLVAAFRFCEELLDHATGNAGRPAKSDEIVRLHSAAERIEHLRKDRVVYYMVIGPYIKIGTTEHLRKRMHDLAADALLATEPGWFDLERCRHRQFAHLRLTELHGNSELFRPGDDLLEHIDRIAAAEDSVIV